MVEIQNLEKNLILVQAEELSLVQEGKMIHLHASECDHIQNQASIHSQTEVTTVQSAKMIHVQDPASVHVRFREIIHDSARKRAVIVELAMVLVHHYALAIIRDQNLGLVQKALVQDVELVPVPPFELAIVLVHHYAQAIIRDQMSFSQIQALVQEKVVHDCAPLAQASVQENRNLVPNVLELSLESKVPVLKILPTIIKKQTLY